MKTCERFTRIKAGYEQDIRFLRSYAERNPGTAPAKTSEERVHGQAEHGPGADPACRPLPAMRLSSQSRRSTTAF